MRRAGGGARGGRLRATTLRATNLRQAGWHWTVLPLPCPSLPCKPSLLGPHPPPPPTCLPWGACQGQRAVQRPGGGAPALLHEPNEHRCASLACPAGDWARAGGRAGMGAWGTGWKVVHALPSLWQMGGGHGPGLGRMRCRLQGLRAWRPAHMWARMHAAPAAPARSIAPYLRRPTALMCGGAFLAGGYKGKRNCDESVNAMKEALRRHSLYPLPAP